MHVGAYMFILYILVYFMRPLCRLFDHTVLITFYLKGLGCLIAYKGFTWSVSSADDSFIFETFTFLIPFGCELNSLAICHDVGFFSFMMGLFNLAAPT